LYQIQISEIWPEPDVAIQVCFHISKCLQMTLSYPNFLTFTL